MNTNALTTGNAIVDAIATIEFAGNITPLSWYQEILLESGRVDLNGIAILADIVYWYRPSITTNELGETVMKKKFKSDLLQRSYAQISKRLNLTEDQAKKAVRRLERGGYIKRQLRTEVHKGIRYSNVMYLELMPERIKEITYSVDEGEGVSVNIPTPACIETDTPLLKSRQGSDLRQILACKKEATNTKITTKITSKDYTSINLIRDGFKEQIDYENLIIDLPRDKDLVNQIVEIATEILSSENPTSRVNGEDRPTGYVQERYRMLNIETIKYVIATLREHTSGVSNVRAFLISALFNAPATIDAYYGFQVSHDFAKSRS